MSDPDISSTCRATSSCQCGLRMGRSFGRISFWGVPLSHTIASSNTLVMHMSIPARPPAPYAPHPSNDLLAQATEVKAAPATARVEDQVLTTSPPTPTAHAPIVLEVGHALTPATCGHDVQDTGCQHFIDGDLGEGVGERRHQDVACMPGSVQERAYLRVLSQRRLLCGRQPWAHGSMASSRRASR